MKVRTILEQKGAGVETISESASLHAAIRMLNERRIGALVVTGRSGGVAGILSERDILRECGARCDAAGDTMLESVGRVLVATVMTRDVVTGGPDDDLTYVMTVMTERRIRHLPIVENGELLGIISIGDAVKACVQMAEAENRLLKEYISGSY